jgi:hypothetical protein
VGEGEERLLEIAPAKITVQAVSLYQVGYAEQSESARTRRDLPSLLLWPNRGVPALSVFIAARLKFFHLGTRHS